MVAVERWSAGSDVNGLFHPALKPSTFSVKDGDLFLEMVFLGEQVLPDGGGVPLVFCQSLFKSPFCLSHVLGVAVLASEMVNYPAFVFR